MIVIAVRHRLAVVQKLNTNELSYYVNELWRRHVFILRVSIPTIALEIQTATRYFVHLFSSRRRRDHKAAAEFLTVPIFNMLMSGGGGGIDNKQPIGRLCKRGRALVSPRAC